MAGDEEDQMMTRVSPLPTDCMANNKITTPSPNSYAHHLMANIEITTPPPQSPNSYVPQLHLDDLYDFQHLMANNDEITTSPTSSVPHLDDLHHFPSFIARSRVLDFFYHAVPEIPDHLHLPHYLTHSWNEDPLTTLKLICYLRTVRRGTKKRNEKVFYTAMLWLQTYHPKTLACNVASFAHFGCFKDLLELLYRLLEGPAVREVQKHEREEKKSSRYLKGRSSMTKRNDKIEKKGRAREKIVKKRKAKEIIEKKRNERSAVPREERIANEKVRVENEKNEAKRIRQEKRTAAAKKATDRYNSDPNYQFLHDKISDLFTECLKSDLDSLNSGKLQQIGLAAKWCPSLDSSYDRATLLCYSIARRMFPMDADNTCKVRDRLRKEVLVPLRRALELPEVFISENRWNELPYNRVASAAKKKYTKFFLERDEKRFKSYQKMVKKKKKCHGSKKRMTDRLLLPNEVIMNLDSVEKEVDAEVHWKRIVEDLSKVGKMKNGIAVCDFPWGMEKVSVALGLLVSELSEDPWKGKVINFSYKPKVNVIQGDSLKAKTEFIKDLDRSFLNITAVFDRLLEVAVEAGLKEVEMVKRVFVFTSEAFDFFPFDYEEIERKFGEKGYGNVVPELVFWNFGGTKVKGSEPGKRGVAMVSGFSNNLLKMFLGVVSPVQVVEALTAGKEYKKLAVFD